LERELQRHWLIWRDEAIRGGLFRPDEVRRAALDRQMEWEQTPHPRLGGRTPLDAIQEERRERETSAP
ncbi:MAG: MbcA/ParS/Xre antitoxin family protein, partial [Gemmatimonadota bacterium]|nr:MbcA/ParS/Xre antitoxin family protein [Gemmatimonadota bacterium]